MDKIKQITFEEFQEENIGNGDKYISNRKINEQIHSNNQNKRDSQIFIMKDWENKSNHFISCHTWDAGRGKFITLGNLEIEMNKIK